MRLDRHFGSAGRCQGQEFALAQWDDEGGAGPVGRDSDLASRESQSDVPPLTNTELVQLQVRVIALENLIIALLVQAREPQLELVREMAAHISPIPVFTPHRLTIHAAAEMISLVDRASKFRGWPPS